MFGFFFLVKSSTISVCRQISFCSLTKQGGGDYEDPGNSESEAAGAHYVWHYLKLQITLQQRRADPRMLFSRFARNLPVAAALPEPLHISWCVPSWAKTKQEENHVLQSIKGMNLG
jgi:hypothetical protein